MATGLPPELIAALSQQQAGGMPPARLAASLLPKIVAEMEAQPATIANSRRAVFIGGKARELAFGPFTMPPCDVCRRRKAPLGRSVPMEMANGLCDSDCPGYYQRTYPSSYWRADEEPLPGDEERHGHRTPS